MRTVYRDGARLQRRIGGAIASLVTPFSNDEIDCVALAAHIEWQIQNGIDGLAVCGLAGESPTLTMGERQTVIGLCIDAAAGKVPTIAATGSHCTEETIATTRLARQAGADAALVSVPYYSKPTQKGIVAHFSSLAAATDMPIIIDNNPSHTGIDLTPATIEQLGQIDAVIGFADGAGRSPADVWARLLLRRVGLFTSQDTTALAFTLMGGAGVFSDAANVAPRLTAALQHAAVAGNLTAATCLQDRLAPLWHAIASDGTAAVLKHALRLEGRFDVAEVRLPFVGVEPTTDLAIREALSGLAVASDGAARPQPLQSQVPVPMRF